MDDVAWVAPKAGVNTHAAGEFRAIPLNAIDQNDVAARHFENGAQKKSKKMLRWPVLLWLLRSFQQGYVYLVEDPQASDLPYELSERLSRQEGRVKLHLA